AAGAVSIYVLACSSSDSSDSNTPGTGGSAGQTGGSGGTSGTGGQAGTGGSNGSGTGGSTGATGSILQDASWSLTGDRTITTVTWNNHAGASTQARAVAGEVEILVDGHTTSRAAVTATIESHGGTL